MKTTFLDWFHEIDNIDCQDEDGNRPILLAAELNCLDIVQILINKGVNIYCKNKKGEDPLKLSIKKGNDEMFNIILNYMNKLKSESPEGKRQLMEEKLIKACKEGDINYLKETLNK